MNSLPSVTTILSPWSRFDAVPDDVLAVASERGTRVHSACLAAIRGLWVEPDPIIEPFVASFKQWLPCVDRVISAEAEYADSDLGFIGHPDLVFVFRGDSFASIVDFKTPAQKNPIWRAQIAAYRHLVEKNGLLVGRTGSLRLSRTGGRAIFDEYTGTMGLDLAGFFSAFDAWKYFHHLQERMI